MSDIPNQDESPLSRKWHVYTSFAQDIDLIAETEGAGFPARAIDVVSGGVVVCVKPNGTTETTPTLAAGYQIKGQISKIKASGSGTTATAVIVYW